MQQMITGAVLGIGTALIQEILRAMTKAQFHLQMSWLGILLWRLPGKIAVDLGKLGIVLWQALRGKRARGAYSEQHASAGIFAPGEAGRRALLIAGISTAPNTFVVAVELKKKLLRLHELVPARPSTDKEWPL